MLRNWQVYLLRCSDDSLYCGVTNNLENRVLKHNQGRGAKYTRSRLPVELAAVRDSLTKVEAFRIEYRIKKMPARQKISALEGLSL